MHGKLVPLFTWLPAYQGKWFRCDLVAGLTASAVIIPKAMAYAAIAGLPLVVGLYSSIIPLVIYAVLGTSRVLSVTTTSTIAILVAGTISQLAAGADGTTLMAIATTLSLLVGSFLLLAGVLRLGAVANLISEPVLTGFKAGIGLVIVLDQLPKLLGIHIAKAGFFRDIAAIGQHLAEFSMPTLMLALIMLGLMVGLEHFAPRVPAPLVTVAAGIALAAFGMLDGKGIQLVGEVQAGLPAFALPDLALAEKLWPSALGIALMSFVETAAAGRAFVLPGEPRPKANQELVALGAANLAGSLFQIMPAGGGTSQTAVNRGAGAQSQVAGLVAAAVVVATLLFLAPLFGLMPQPTLAAVVVVASIGLISPAEFRAIRNVRTMEFRWALIAMVGVMVLGTLKGILVAVVISLVGLILYTNRRPVYVLGRKPGTTTFFRPLSTEHPEDETFPGLLLLKIEGNVHFANASRLGDQLWPLIHQYQPRVVALDCSAMPDLEYTALKMLTEAETKLRESGIVLWLATLNPEPLQLILKTPLGEALGRERMIYSLKHVVEEYQRRYGEAAERKDRSP
jgi:high affinity sulfate transporter 1